MGSKRTQLKIKGMKRWKKALDSRGFDKVARKNIRRATMLNAKIMEERQRWVIQTGKDLKRNADLTQMIKGDDKPLVDSASLFQSITSKMIDDFTAFIGVIRSSSSYNVAVRVHEGVAYRVSEKTKNMFSILAKASSGVFKGKLEGRAKELFERNPHGWLPITKDIIRIPPRKWILIAFRQKGVRAQLRDNWRQALEASFRERAKG